MNKKRRSDHELIEASNHLAYEIWMMRGCETRLGKMSQPPPDLIVFNALLNSFLMHARATIEFVYTESRAANNDHVIAEDFFKENPEHWQRHRPEKTALLQHTHVAAQQATAHLTYKRINKQSFWNWTKIRRDLDSIMNEFIKQVPENRIHADLRRLF